MIVQIDDELAERLTNVVAQASKKDPDVTPVKLVNMALRALLDGWDEFALDT